MDLPSGVVTFLFTDIEGSTRLFHELGDRYMAVLEEHRTLIRDACANRGVELKTEGDSFFIAFARPSDAVAACLDGQRALERHSWPEGVVVKVRMGLHTGEAVPSGDDYVALAVHQAARVANAAHGGQVLLSSTTADVVAGSLPDGCSLRDLGAFRLRDFAEPLRLHQLCHDSLRARFPPLRTPTASTLPVPRTSFVGRDEEVEIVGRMVTAGQSITVTGTGGTGKSRLAAEVALRVSDEFGDGIYWVELAGTSDPSLVPQAVAESLGVQEQPGRLLAHTVADHLCTKRALVVLDNCEHLLDACAAMVEKLLAVCDRLVVVATSREPLGVEGEATYRVPSLTESTAVQLFVERARLANPSFAIDDENAAAVTQLCLRLDGIPLAIELAASRLRSLSVADLAARIDDRFSLLSGGARTALPRQQTLRGMVDWSYELLNPDEKRLFACLAAFAGSFTLRAVEAVGPPDVDTISLLSGLVDKSLVVLDDQHANPRYRLLQTIRHYAVEKLIESGDAAQTRTRHRDLYLKVACEAFEELEAARDDKYWDLADRWAQVFETAHDDLRAALDWSSTLDQPTETRRFVEALAWFWLKMGHWAEGRSRAEEAYVDASTEELIEGLSILGAFAWRQADHAAGAGYAERRVELVRQSGDLKLLSRALNQRATNYWLMGRFDEADADYRELLGLADELDDRNQRRLTLNNLGLSAQSRGDMEEAERLFTSLAEMARGDKHDTTVAHFRLGNLALELGDIDRAAASSETLLQLFRDQPEVFTEHLAGDVARARGRWADARAHYAKAADAYGQNADGRAWEVLHVGRAAMEEGDVELARTCFDESVATFRRLGDLAKIAESAGDQARLATVMGDDAGALGWWRESVDAWRRAGAEHRLAAALFDLARAARHAGSNYEVGAALNECIALCEARAAYPATQRLLADALAEKAAFVG